MEAAAKKDIRRYADGTQLKVELIVYVDRLELFDIDNLTKLVGDALQGSKSGQRRKARFKHRLLSNDKWICLWKVEKRVSDAKVEHQSRLFVQQYRADWQLRTAAGRKRVC
jgi:hypothetical protein